MSLEYHLEGRKNRLEAIVKHIVENPGISFQDLAEWISFTQGLRSKTVREYLDVIKYRVQLRDGKWFPVKEAQK